MQLPGLDAFTLAHLLSFLDQRSHGALTLTHRACGDHDSAIRHTFLQRCIVHLPETPLFSPAAAILSTTLPATITGDVDSEDPAARQLKILRSLLAHPGVTKLLVKCSEADGHWVDTLVQFLSLQVASKVTMLQIKQSAAATATTNSTTTRGQAQGDQPEATSAVRSLLSRMRRNHQPMSVERANATRQWLQLTAAMPNLQELDLSLIKVTTIEWLPKLLKLKRLSLDAAELTDKRGLLAPLGELRSLESLYVQNYMAPHAQEIAKLRPLKSLWINECAVLEDLSALGQLKRLEELTLTHMTAVEDLTFIQELSSLEKLKVSFVGQEPQWLELPELRSASSLVSEAHDEHEAATSVLSLPRLISVTFQRLRLRNLNFLALCPNLRRLAINAHEVTTIEMVATVPELRDLKLSIDTVRGGKLSLSPLQSLSKLVCLELVTLRGRLQSDSLPFLPSLKTLIMPAMDDFEPLCHRLSSLSSLTVHDCSQVDVDYAPVLADLQMLAKLTLTFPIATGRSESSSGRPLDLSPLQSLTQLRSLSLIHVNTEDLSPLSELLNLEALDLSAFYSTHLLNPSIADFSPLTRLENLRSLSVAGRSDFEESDLEMLRSSNGGGGGDLKNLRRINTTELVIPTLNSAIW
ncbi:hypothetical protein Gpo141_00005882 [Globisporangium polare]